MITCINALSLSVYLQPHTGLGHTVATPSYSVSGEDTSVGGGILGGISNMMRHRECQNREHGGISNAKYKWINYVGINCHMYDDKQQHKHALLVNIRCAAHC